MNDEASDLAAASMQVALAWLLQRSPNILLIPGTSAVEDLHENLAAALLHLPSHARGPWTQSPVSWQLLT
jgi:aryl-alcohol dehydrogenase-like predicted oxidoreductase